MCEASETMSGKRVADPLHSSFPSVKICRHSPMVDGDSEPLKMDDEMSQAKIDCDYDDVPHIEKIMRVERNEMNSEKEKIKRRRSSMRRCSFVSPLLSQSANIEDCMKIMSQNLPYTSKLSLLLEMGIKNVLNQSSTLCGGSHYDDLGKEIIMDLQSICSKVANDFVGKKIDAAKCYDKSKSSESENSSMKRSEYQSKQDKLTEEYNSWKSLMKKRKLDLQQAQRELKESLNGATYLEEEVVRSTLTEEHENILSARPDYNLYLDNVKLSQQQLLHTQDELKKTKILLSSLTKVSKVTSDACYSMIEKDTLKDFRSEDVTGILLQF